MKSVSRLVLAVVMTAVFTTGAFAADQAVTEAKAGVAKAQLLSKHPALAQVLNDAAGYVIFPSVAKGGLGIGAARGKGQVYEKGKPIGAATMTQVTFGFQMGGQVYSEFIIFMDQAGLDSFRKGQFEFSAQASAVAAVYGVSFNVPYEKGVKVVTLSKLGLMYEAALGGQKFKYKDN